MSLSSILTAAANRRKSLHYYGSEPTALDEQFAGRNVTVEHHDLPPNGPSPFVAIRDTDDFRGAVTVDDLESLLAPATSPPWRIDEAATSHRPLYELLDDTVFASLDRRQLLGAAREIEDRAYRVGTGRLHVGFQSLAAFDDQQSLYRRLAAETDLDIHVYVVDQAPTDELPGITVHVEPTPEIGRFWVMAFDGGDEPQQCALVARQHDDTYEGVWTYEMRLVERVFAALDAD